jgi:NADH-quinone oxidoreductase subunit A
LQTAALPIVLFFGAVIILAIVLLLLGRICNPSRAGRVKQMPYESGMDPVHDTRRRFDIRFHLLAIAFLVFDVELLFLYPWAVAVRDRTEGATGAVQAVETGSVPTAAAPSRPVVRPVFIGGFVFLVLLTLGFVYDWRKGVFRWR